MIFSTISAPSLPKRKSDVDFAVGIPEQPSTKKLKVTQTNPDAIPQVTKLANATDEYPNGFVYCHQCNKKRDAAASVHCTVKDHKGRRCGTKYCKPCLKNRYGLILEDIVAEGETEETVQDEHVQGQDYHFKCPRCDDVCNCVACRKAKGLQPTGNLANAARQSGLTSAADVLRQDPTAAGPMAHKPSAERAEKKGRSQQVTAVASSKQDDRATKGSLSAPVKGNTKLQPAAKTQHTAKSTKDAKSQVESRVKPGLKPKVKALPKLKPVAKPVWTIVDTALSLIEAEERISIREFALRFSSIMELSRTHLDELEELRSLRTRNVDDEDEDLVPWVSEACVKSLILGLLSLLDANGDREKHLNAAIMSIQDSGANLNKVWAALATLRDRQANVSTSSRSTSTTFPLSYPDPLPPPESATMMRTRSGANQSHTGYINVFRTAQLLPVIYELVNAAVESEAVRQEIEAGIQAAKERVKEAREAHRIENERFEQEKERGKAKEKKLDKSRMECHKRVVADCDDALKVSSCAYIPRISPLGRDMEGRVYWALTPGMNEREAALDHLQSYSQGRTRKSTSRARRKPLVPSEEDRSALKRWSWFLAVWGERPPVAERTIIHDPDSSEDEDEDEGEDDGEERWWGFWDPEEIKKLASWIQAKAGLEDVLDKASVKGARVGSKSRTPSPDSDVDLDDLTDSEVSDDGMRDVDMKISATPTKDEVRSLVRELEQYATLLQCRIRREEGIEDADPSMR
ncbi:hypothetical protein PAXINDRAFT_179413 [Paxillus involutus ATCC 200175]|nr:hypothetical protein PAXINDRAFT_179413 [Paxillus involutus ATCC 200175]